MIPEASMTPSLYIQSELQTVLEGTLAAVKSISLLFCVGLLLVLTVVMICVGAVTFKRWLGEVRTRCAMDGADGTATRYSFVPWRSPGSLAGLNNQWSTSQTSIPSGRSRPG
jgi:hypothetical protein